MAQYWPFSNVWRWNPIRERLIVSLEPGSTREALELVSRLQGQVGMFLVGRRSYLRGGAEFVRQIRQRGGEFFLDLRFHDDPPSVARAAVEATRLGARMFDLHPQCSREVMARVKAEVARVCRNESMRRPLILGVSIMSTLQPHRHEQAGQKPGNNAGAEEVLQTARRAADASLDGALISARQTSAVRAACGRRFVLVVSGVSDPRSPGDGLGPRTAPAEALRQGADYLVVSGLVWQADDPARAVRQLVYSIERTLRLAPRSPFELFGSSTPG